MLLKLFPCWGPTARASAYEEATSLGCLFLCFSTDEQGSSGGASDEYAAVKGEGAPVSLHYLSSDTGDEQKLSAQDAGTVDSTHLKTWEPAQDTKASAQGLASKEGQVRADTHHPQVRQSLEVLMQAGLSRQPHVTWCKSRDLVRDVHELRWVGQGSQGVVYEGVWQGASVAVKWSIADELDAGAYELLFSRLLSHPNVVQTYDAKVAMLESDVIAQRGPSGTAAAAQPQSGVRSGAGASSAALTAAQLEPASLQRCNSYQSDEGFGDPLGRPSAMSDVRDMLQLIGAKPGQHITQLIMEYCDQGSLLTAISRGIFLPNGRFGSKVALRALYRTAREVAQGMVHLHCANVIHGDLKPANVLLMNSRKDRRGFVAKVSDFGLAQYCPAAGHVKDAPWGTLVFMAPERFRLNMLTPASDVWSFGVMLWQMFTARLPYEGTRQAQLMLGITTNTLTLDWPEGAPAALVALARACMSYSPAQRPTFSALMQQLAVLESEVRMEGVRLSFSTDVTGTSTPNSCATAGTHGQHGSSLRHDTPAAAAAALRARVTTQDTTSFSVATSGTPMVAPTSPMGGSVDAGGSHGSSGGRGSSTSYRPQMTPPSLQSLQASGTFDSCPRSPNSQKGRAATAFMRHGSASAVMSGWQGVCATVALARAAGAAQQHTTASTGSRLHSAISQPLGSPSPSPRAQPSANSGSCSPALAAALSSRASPCGAPAPTAAPGAVAAAPRVVSPVAASQLGVACSAAAAATLLMRGAPSGTSGGQAVYSTGGASALPSHGVFNARAAAAQQAALARAQAAGQPGPALSQHSAAPAVTVNSIKVDTTTRSFEISPAAAAGMGGPPITPVFIKGP